jgi:hypothetical protein
LTGPKYEIIAHSQLFDFNGTGPQPFRLSMPAPAQFDSARRKCVATIRRVSLRPAVSRMNHNRPESEIATECIIGGFVFVSHTEI